MIAHLSFQIFRVNVVSTRFVLGANIKIYALLPLSRPVRYVAIRNKKLLLQRIVKYAIKFMHYRIQSNYRTYPYKRTVKKFHSLQITASVIFLYFLLKAYVVGTHLNSNECPQHMPL